MCLLWVLLVKNFKKLLSYLNSAKNLVKKQKWLNLEPKMPDLGIFGLKFESNVLTFEISTLKLVQLQNFVKKLKCLNLGLKMPDLGIFDQKCCRWEFWG